MTDLRRAMQLTMLVASAALTFAACSSSASSATPSASAEAPAPPSVAATASEAPASEAPASEAPATSAEASAAPFPTFDLKALSGALPGVDSYRTSTTVSGVKQYESVVVKQPVLSKAITVFDDAGKVSTRYVIIGSDAWSADGADGAFTSIPSAQATALLMVYDPALMLGAYASIDWSTMASDQGSEQKNGVQARHVRIDPTTFIGAAGAMPAGSAIDVWVADAGYLVAWEMTGFPNDANFAIEVTNINDPANKVEKPS